MKFACVEYTTKSHKIWIPSEEHPNYLGDPLSEIDPTSFGSYTTAFNGQHVPLTGAILGQLDGNVLQGLYQRLHWRLLATWGNYSLGYFKNFDTLLVVYDWKRGNELAKFVKRLRATYPAMVIVGVPTQPFGQLRDQWRSGAEHLSSLIEFYNSCHAVLSIVRATVPYQQSLTKTPVVYIPQPYPAEYAQKSWREPADKESIIFIAGETSRPDILAGHLAAKEIQRQFRDSIIHVTATPDSPLNTQLLKGTIHEIVPFRPWRQYLPYLAGVKIVLNMDTWWTRGRVQADCAAVGTASIGGPSDAQTELFPELMVRDVEDFHTAIKLGTHLLGDNSFYSETTERARHRILSYNFENTVTRFTKLVDLIKKDEVQNFPEFHWVNNVLVEK
ncbi:MAG: hypothetical protein Q7S57_02425 [bacterium]|nr:hypothetical protein [bacterium]